MTYVIIDTSIGYLCIVPYMDKANPLGTALGTVEITSCEKDGTFSRNYNENYIGVILSPEGKRVVGILPDAAVSVVIAAAHEARTEEFMMGARNAAIMQAHLCAVKNLNIFEDKLRKAQNDMKEVDRLAENAGITDQTDAQLREIDKINR